MIDKTYGHAAYGCGTCCGYSPPTLLPNPFGGAPGINNNDVMQSTEQCGGDLVDLADDAYNWNSSNTAAATLPTKTLHTVAVGSATGTGTVYEQADKPAPRCPMAYYSPSQQVKVANVTCTPSVTRGGTATCTATGPSGSTFSNWKFSDGTNSPVTSNSTSSTWSGVMVTGGTISVTITSGGKATVPTAQITVNNRTNFAFTAVAPTQASGNSLTCYGGQTTILVSPPNSTSLGASCTNLAFSFHDAPVTDNGPNDGYQYVTSVSSTNGSQPTQFPYIVVSDFPMKIQARHAASAEILTTPRTSPVANLSQFLIVNKANANKLAILCFMVLGTVISPLRSSAQLTVDATGPVRERSRLASAGTGGGIGRKVPLGITVAVLGGWDEKGKIELDFILTNTGTGTLTIPTSPNPGDLEPMNPKMDYRVTCLTLRLAPVKEPGGILAGGADLYGSPTHPGTLATLSPGESVRVLTRVALPHLAEQTETLFVASAMLNDEIVKTENGRILSELREIGSSYSSRFTLQSLFKLPE